jgi:hypothetical protein
MAGCRGYRNKDRETLKLEDETFMIRCVRNMLLGQE